MTNFYPASRAHHAYVMSLDFGMKFSKRDGLWTPEGLLTVTGAGGYKIEIAEESMRLLEPRHGDVMRWGDVVFIYGESPPAELPAWDRGIAIIQRDGKPFHWPEQEKAEGKV